MNEEDTTQASTGGAGGGREASGAPKVSAAGAPSAEERQWAMFTHLAAFAMVIVPYVGNILGPLVMWLIKKDQMPFVDNQGKEAVNFQISMVIYGIVAAALLIVGIGFILIPVVFIVDIVFVIVATLKANEGVAYRYPLSIRFIK